jgi:hypothetical protein
LKQLIYVMSTPSVYGLSSRMQEDRLSVTSRSWGWWQLATSFPSANMYVYRMYVISFSVICEITVRGTVTRWGLDRLRHVREISWLFSLSWVGDAMQCKGSGGRRPGQMRANRGLRLRARPRGGNETRGWIDGDQPKLRAFRIGCPVWNVHSHERNAHCYPESVAHTTSGNGNGETRVRVKKMK